MTATFLSHYTEAEGLVEDIAYAYLQPGPLSVVEPLLARRPWSGEAMAKMLVEVLKVDYPNTADHRDCYFGEARPGLVEQWRWATQVRNDLAHTTGQWVDSSGRGGRPETGLWKLRTRSARRHSDVKVLKEPLTVEDMAQHLAKAFELTHALSDLAAHLGVLVFNGYEGAGPKFTANRANSSTAG